MTSGFLWAVRRSRRRRAVGGSPYDVVHGVVPLPGRVVRDVLPLDTPGEPGRSSRTTRPRGRTSCGWWPRGLGADDLRWCHDLGLPPRPGRV